VAVAVIVGMAITTVVNIATATTAKAVSGIMMILQELSLKAIINP
jgi:hypothetical protein